MRFILLNAMLKLMRKHQCPFCSVPTKNDDICEKCSKEIDMVAEKIKNEELNGEWK